MGVKMPPPIGLLAPGQRGLTGILIRSSCPFQVSFGVGRERFAPLAMLARATVIARIGVRAGWQVVKGSGDLLGTGSRAPHRDGCILSRFTEWSLLASSLMSSAAQEDLSDAMERRVKMVRSFPLKSRPVDLGNSFG